MRGESNHEFLKGAEFVCETRTKPEFSLYDLGQYPAAVKNGTTSITGELYNVNDDMLKRLDTLEGYPTFYTRKHIKLENGDNVIIYLLPEKFALKLSRGEITSGDWRMLSFDKVKED